jgi:hypothetical protein
MPKNTWKEDKRFKPRKTAPTIIQSAITAIKGILQMDILENHKRILIKDMVYRITSAHGKYTTIYRSEDAWKKRDCRIEHEHVYTRQELVQEIMDHPKRVEDVLEKAIPCIVTEDEHKLLTRVSKGNPELKGWERYKKARIAVYDMRTHGKYIDPAKEEEAKP